MNDRELLELAARAAGIKARWFKVNQWRRLDGCRLHLGQKDVFGTHHRKPWNPRDDDGDALRLAVKLRMEIDHNHPADERAWVSVRTQGERTCAVEEFDDESLRAAATRMAITRAAAEIGKSMGGVE